MIFTKLFLKSILLHVSQLPVGMAIRTDRPEIDQRSRSGSFEVLQINQKLLNCMASKDHLKKKLAEKKLIKFLRRKEVIWTESGSLKKMKSTPRLKRIIVCQRMHKFLFSRAKVNILRCVLIIISCLIFL